MNTPPAEYQDYVAKKKLADGVEMYQYGNDGEIAVRFFTFAKYDKNLSRVTELEQFRDVEMIEKVIDKDNVLHRPATAHDKRQYADLYNRFKKGLEATGTKIRNWDALTMSEQAVLEVNGIFTVEQFAEVRDSKLERMPNFKEKQERAKQHVRAKNGIIETKEYGDRLVAQEKRITELTAKLEEVLGAKPEVAPVPEKQETPAVAMPRRVNRSVVTETKNSSVVTEAKE